MTPTRTRFDQRWLRVFADTLREFDQQAAWTDVNCIEATRFGMEVFTRLGMRAEPLSLQAIFMNPASVAARDAGVPKESWPEDAAWVAVENTGWVDSPWIWDGHVTLSVSPQPGLDLRKTVLLDLSADQFNRAEFGLHVAGPVIVPLRRDWSAERPITVQVGENRLEYRPSDRVDYVSYPAWASYPDSRHEEFELLLQERRLI